MTLPETIERAFIGQAYNQSVAATPALTLPNVYSYTMPEGATPFGDGGFTLNSATGLLHHDSVTGPVQNIDIRVTATDSNNCFGSAAYRLKIRTLTTGLALLGDYDDDGKSAYVVWSVTTGEWQIHHSASNQPQTLHWGTVGDVPLLGDYDGDGKTDLAVFRPSNGAWYIKQSSNGQVLIKPWGVAKDVPVPGDYDGDHRTDIAVWRPNEGNWYVCAAATSKPRSQCGAQATRPITTRQRRAIMTGTGRLI